MFPFAYAPREKFLLLLPPLGLWRKLFQFLIVSRFRATRRNLISFRKLTFGRNLTLVEYATGESTPSHEGCTVMTKLWNAWCETTCMDAARSTLLAIIALTTSTRPRVRLIVVNSRAVEKCSPKLVVTVGEINHLSFVPQN